MNISELQIGRSAAVKAVGGDGKLRARLLDMGLVPGVGVKVVKRAPLGDPIELRIRSYNLSLRAEEAAMIEVDALENEPSAEKDCAGDDFGYHLSSPSSNAHPGFGEEGRYHNHEDEKHALPKGTQIRLAIVGQQNCGKTSLFNALTGSNVHVGNLPGQTTEAKQGRLRGYADASVTDLPGMSSMTPRTNEELLTLKFLLEQKPHCIVNVVDTNNIERNLYLTVQLMELKIPMVLALNMMDEIRGNGGSIRLNELEAELGIPVVPVSALRNEGLDELASHAVHVARYQEVPAHRDLCDAMDNGGSVHRCIHGISHLIEEHAIESGIPAHFAATKLAEGDTYISGLLHLSEAEISTVDGIVRQMERERGMDRAAAVADMRYTYIDRLCRKTVIRPSESKEYRRSRNIDRVLTGKWTALPIFIIIIGLIIYCSIDLFGAPLQDVLRDWINALGQRLDAIMLSAGVSEVVRSLVQDGIFAGVGSVLSFIPIILILFFFLSILEDSGYMSRIAFFTDRLLKRLGLSGRSIIPLLIGFGCSVPAVMASRTLPSSSDRRKTIMLIPFMSCSAKIPLYAFLSAAFFPGHGSLVFICMYLTGIAAAVLTALANKRFGSKTEAAPFIMEMPNYRMPSVKSVARLLWDKTKDFLTNAFTIIFLASIVIWFFRTFTFRFTMAENGEGSMLAWVAGLLAPLFKPVGLGDWRIVTSLISGLIAKESVVSSMSVLGVTSLLDTASALSMLVFCLLYTPCVAAIAAVRRELGGKYAAFMVIFQCTLAWFASLIVYNLALWLV